METKMKLKTRIVTLLISLSSFAQDGLLKNIKDIIMKGSIYGSKEGIRVIENKL
jgi:hypothetical protein